MVKFDCMICLSCSTIILDMCHNTSIVHKYVIIITMLTMSIIYYAILQINTTQAFELHLNAYNKQQINYNKDNAELKVHKMTKI